MDPFTTGGTQGKEIPGNTHATPIPSVVPESQNFIPIALGNPFQNVPKMNTASSPGHGGKIMENILERVSKYNPSTVSPLRRRPKKDAGYFKKTPRYYFPERPDLKPSILEREGPIKFIPAGEGNQPEQDDQMQQPPQGIITHLQSGHSQSSTNMELVPRKPGKQSKKRALDMTGDPEVYKKLKITPQKPATALLNEISPNLDFIYEDVKESLANPKFLCKVKFPLGETGQEYIGVGRSKKLAKLNASENILRSLGTDIPPVDETMEIEPAKSNIMNTITTPMINYLAPNFIDLPFIPSTQDFTKDEDVEMFSSEFCVKNLNPQAIELPSLKRLKNIPDFENNSLCALNTFIGPEAVEFEEISQDGPPHNKKFVLKLCLKTGMTFIGTGGSKKRAKQHAAKQALIALIGSNVYQLLILESHGKTNQKPQQQQQQQTMECLKDTPEKLIPAHFINEDLINASEYDLTFSDYIARIVNEKYEDIMANHQDYISQKVLAGIVMTRSNPMIENGEVIAVTTGTKCVEGDFMSTDGLAINDCHAEILATRCLRDFLYSEVENIGCSTTDEEFEESILKEVKSDTGEVFYMVKENVKFHLYISTSPCGDARIFSPKGLEATDEEIEPTDDLQDSHPTRRNRGVLRAKVEAGEGTIPVANLLTGPQTFDSIVQGNALFTMSCSDKLCRWNVIGIQGALLSNLMFPVYYSSVILGSLHHPVHFKRALLGRIESLAGKIPLPFKINRAHLLMVSHQEKRVVKKSPNHAICWTYGWSTPEILTASKGRCEPGGIVSRLAKRMSFIRFLTLYRNQWGRRDGFVNLNYKEAKLMAGEYQKAKDAFQAHMKDTNYGTWISKPVEIDSFGIEK
ncbi:double-stranded RNA-specific editase Adar [Folsomia candida]|uniref:double-stranded RNA-specific editase Adar n=1 Tax=Folsomia candida TaxID=158441 RepID=UPI000B8FD136|nr:double-stranded RNA-specific editase Adar [Folsomia candida]